MSRARVLFGVCLLLTLTSRGVADEPSHLLIPMFDNDSVRVWKTILKPGERLGMHRHDHGRVVVALAGGTLRIPLPKGGGRDLVLETGKAYWLPADPPGELHGDENPSRSRTLELMVVELR
jgi:quercetin dioxygenase-like cupin family protein